MKEVDSLIFSRLTGDPILPTLLGGSGRIHYSYQPNKTQQPQLNFFLVTSTPGAVRGDFVRTNLLVYQFNVFSKDYPDVLARIRRLFDGYVFSVPSNSTELGQASSVFDWEGAEGYDEALESHWKACRYRIHAVMKAQNPI